ncbi:MAG: aminoglycoside phosphotransferase family protein [Pseudomonadota bacterium]
MNHSVSQNKSANNALRAWGLQGDLSPLGDGHIHDTYRVSTSGDDLVLQRVNEYVFKDGDLVMAQTRRVLDCWRQQEDYICPELVTTPGGEDSARVDGQLWRVWRYLPNTQVLDPIETPQQVEAAAGAFAQFQIRMQALEGPRLVDPISGFGRLNLYLRDFDKAPDAPQVLQQMIDSGRRLADRFDTPTGVIHADCKVNNVLFNLSGSDVVAVIDFDTAMYGHWAWDFGDLVRSVCFSSGSYDSELFLACVRGFADHPHADPEAFADAPAYVALMLGVRFLTDHLTGDDYFRVEEPGQNLARAKEQLSLYTQFVSARAQMVQLASRS